MLSIIKTKGPQVQNYVARLTLTFRRDTITRIATLLLSVSRVELVG